MHNSFLPKYIERVLVPPIKCQGIKTKLVKFIAESIKWHGHGRWVEPFLGSGVVLFNINPDRAIVSDTNKHIINFYRDIQNGKIDGKLVKDFLEEMGAKLFKLGQDFYYEMREKFNTQNGGSLELLFLNRSCYNGIMRFNGNGKFNVPFGHKPERFRRSYVTKIVNQVSTVSQILKNKDWKFKVCDWREILPKISIDDFVYMDPPYIGRHTDYYNNWSEDDAIELANVASKLSCGFALSMWKKNRYRENMHLDLHWNGFETKTFSHFYHVGSKEEFRNEMIEALVIKPEFLADTKEKYLFKNNSPKIKQLSIFG